MVPAEGGCSVISGGESTARAAVPEPGARAGPLGAECCHLAEEVLDKLLKCGAIGEWDNTGECRRECGLPW
jgi:hypothetical protein